MTPFFRRLRWLVGRRNREEELHAELQFHLNEEADERRAGGLTSVEAGWAARRDLGNVTSVKENTRAAWGWIVLEQLAQDLRYSLRTMANNRAFTGLAVLSLALGIGANTAIYSFMDAIMMRALPVRDPQNLVVVNWRAKLRPPVVRGEHGEGYEDPGGIAVSGLFPYPAWELLREHNNGLTALFAFAGAGRLNLVARNQAFLGDGEYVSGNYFGAIGAPASAGRLIGESDDRPGAATVAVISYRLWQRYFNGAADAVGQTILVNRTPLIIAGVTGPEFYGVNPRSSPDIFLPLKSLAYLDSRAQGGDWFHERDNYWLEMMGRLRRGVTLRQAEVPMASRFHPFVASTATNAQERANLPALWLQEGGSGIDSLRREYSKPLYILLAMSGLILAIACANIANLLLSRAAARSREIAIRLSVGAGRWRIVRQLLTESLLLALLGGATGLFVAAVVIRFLTWLLANGQEDFTLHAEIDARILLFTIAVSIFTGAAFGLAPALQATNMDVTPSLKEVRGSAMRVRRFSLPFGLGQVLVAGQIALSLLLVIAAGLFVTTLSKLHSVAVGFNTEKLLLFNVNASQGGYDETRGTAFYESLRQRFGNIPGVRAATMTDMPLVAGAASGNGIAFPGKPASRDHGPSTNVALVGPGFFETMQIPVLLGRPIGQQDTAKAPGVVVVNEVFARKFFPNHSPVGQHFAFEYDKPIDVQIVGVARNSLYSSLTSEVPPVAYLPWSQALPGWLRGGMYYELRTSGDPLAFGNTIRQIVHQANPRLPVADMATQVRYIDATIAPERTFANLCTCFGLLALLIACVGLYGTMAYTVTRRTNEIGIRIALGAQCGTVIWMVQREVLALSFIGLAIGIGVAWQTARFLQSFLFGVRPNDVFVFGMSALVLMTCALTAGYVPAFRASRIDPMQALRNE